MPRLSKRHLVVQGVDPKDTGTARSAFATKLSAMMLQRGWSQAELSAQAGLGRDVVNKYVNAKILPTPGSLVKLSEAFGVPVNELYPWAKTVSVITPRVDSRVVEDIRAAVEELRILLDGRGASALRLLERAADELQRAAR